MLIECILRRTGGTHVDLGSAIYHFAPDEAGRHVADVTDDDHIDRLLAIPEGYRRARTITAVSSTVSSAPSVEEDAGADVSAAEDLAAEYTRLTGQKPDGRWSKARLLSEVEAARKIEE